MKMKMTMKMKMKMKMREATDSFNCCDEMRDERVVIGTELCSGELTKRKHHIKRRRRSHHFLPTSTLFFAYHRQHSPPKSVGFFIPSRSKNGSRLQQCAWLHAGRICEFWGVNPASLPREQLGGDPIEVLIRTPGFWLVSHSLTSLADLSFPSSSPSCPVLSPFPT